MNKLVEINWNPTNRQLRQFGGTCLIALPLIGLLWGANPQAIGALLATGATVAILGLFAPAMVKPLFILLAIIAIPFGLVIGELVLLLIFFGVFLPVGVLFRLMKRDALSMTLNRKATTYWQPKKQPRGAMSYYRQS